MHNFDIICISETFLDSDYSNDDQRLSLDSYAKIRSAHPSNKKRGDVCLYYKEHLPFVRRHDNTSLDECIFREIKVKILNVSSHASIARLVKQQMKEMLSFLGLNRPGVT